MIGDKLGALVKDTVSGFKGIASARHEYLNGCIRYSVTAQELKEGKVIEENFDTEQLVRVGPGVRDAMKLPDAAADATGGPRTVPSRPSVPAR